MDQIINDKNIRENEKKVQINILIAVSIISVALIMNILFKMDSNTSNFELTLIFIRVFNSTLSILAFGSCLISYKRVKQDSVFIISLIYLVLSIDISMGQLDYLSFYYEKFSLSNYITVSTSVLRVSLLILALSGKNKLKTLIISKKKESILFVVLYTIVLGHLEQAYNLTNYNQSSLVFILYNALLIITYLICTFKLFRLGIKEKEYLFVVLGSSILMLAIKAMYVIYGTNINSFHVKITSVSITYISFLVIIFGAFIELYIYICKTKVLNDNLKIFYNLVENNKHSSMYICKSNEEILYANKKIRDEYIDFKNNDLQNLGLIMGIKTEEIGKKEEILKSLEETGVWRGILNNKTNNKTVDCSVQLIDTIKNETDMAITFMDISDEINRELELEKLKVYDKEKSDFISNISHELKTPLNLFYSTVQLLDSISENEDCDFRLTYGKYNKTLHVNCKRMMRLINNVMDISKIDTGMLSPDFGNYDIVSIVEDVTLSVVNYALLKKIHVQFDTNIEEQIIKCDPNMIERVILNLLSNAIKFSKENQTIYVDMLVNEDFIKIYIKDEGIGISKEVKNLIFEKFVQVDKSFTRMNEGSGIGLSIVKSIIELHNGEIEVDSKPNEGSTFIIAIPNISLHDSDFKVYDVSNQNTELELSDIYEISS